MHGAEKAGSLFILAMLTSAAVYAVLSYMPFSAITSVSVDGTPSLERIFLPLAGSSYLSSRRFWAEIAASALPYVDDVSIALDNGKASVAAEYRKDGVMIASHEKVYIVYPDSAEEIDFEDVPFLMGLYPIVEVGDDFIGDPYRRDVIRAARELSGLSSLITWMEYCNNLTDGSSALIIDLPVFRAELAVRDVVSGTDIRESIAMISREADPAYADEAHYELFSDGLVRV